MPSLRHPTLLGKERLNPGTIRPDSLRLGTDNTGDQWIPRYRCHDGWDLTGKIGYCNKWDGFPQRAVHIMGAGFNLLASEKEKTGVRDTIHCEQPELSQK